MPHINLPAALPGIRGPMAFRPQTAGPLNEVVDILVACFKRDFERADISEKLKTLLAIAGKTAKGGKQVESPISSAPAVTAQPTSRFTTRW